MEVSSGNPQSTLNMSCCVCSECEIEREPVEPWSIPSSLVAPLLMRASPFTLGKDTVASHFEVPNRNTCKCYHNLLHHHLQYNPTIITRPWKVASQKLPLAKGEMCLHLGKVDISHSWLSTAPTNKGQRAVSRALEGTERTFEGLDRINCNSKSWSQL